ncbi:signal recognition particle-docking protein FtsY [Mycoplasmopsis anatis]|uniref:signal recognition particle-docking protein FtsY n=1 Tax=Mycoplasmopsis anatis TaxID=171279 RepID=UPI001C4E14B7|nr:signal recognition particle-docking protein FtsY [Mycoplasmopsis anatis]MBW0595656.1 signal recognition particle-docking protein FtsY [Mycoplasmopsis anatis]MBW0596683.1 signal recognition particle-docking protein FtsY [Mycoplasmopsis anatis]MBW0602254.1 signal recognition particle-docking protein FtsY [Mycoplasmopsis anatis]
MKLFKKLKDFFSKDQTKEQLKKISHYDKGLANTSSFGAKIRELQNKHLKIDEEYFEELEEILIMSDINYNLVDQIIDLIKSEVKANKITDPKLIGEIVADGIFKAYTNNTIVNTNLNVKDDRLNVFIMVGVNGSGKTTSIAKLANKFKNEGKKVLIAAADTFRAAAVEQLSEWARRVNVDIIKPDKPNQDPSSVVYKAMDYAKNNNYDLLIIDTAGRLQNKVNLMNELNKMVSVIKKFQEDAPHESLLVMDATTGQNGLSQAKVFKEVSNLTGIILTKLDGTSKGGIILSIKNEFDLNVKYVGMGEQVDDLQEFDLELFIYEMTKELINE